MKFKIKTISMAVIGALISGSVMAAGVSATNSDLFITDGNIDATDSNVAMSAIRGYTLSVIDKNIIATTKLKGIEAQDSKVIVGDSTTNSVNISAHSSDASQHMYAIWANNVNDTNTNVSVDGKTIHLSATNDGGSSRAVVAQTGAVVNLGSSQTETLQIDAVGNEATMGVWASYNETDKTNGGKINIKAKNFILNSDGVYGLLAQNNSEFEDPSAGRAQIVVDAENTVINSAGSGIMAFSNGLIDIKGNLTVNAPTAIDTRGNATININTDGKGTVVLNGDIAFETPGSAKNSGNVLNSNLNLVLSGEGSVWNGNAYKEYPEMNKDNEKYTEVQGFSITLADGAQWNANQYEWTDDPKTVFEGLAINNLTFDNGVINVLHGSEQSIEIGNLKGSGGTINLTAKTADGKTIDAGSVNAKTVDKGVALDVNAVGITADDIVDPESALNSLNEKVNVQAEKTNSIAEGDVKGAIEQTVTADGQQSAVRISENTKLASMKGVNAAALVAWRDEVAYTNQRMEFLRDHEHAYGAWGQVYGGESTYEGKVDLKTTTVQVGADAAVGDWVVGAAFSYMNGDADMHNGNADTDAYTVSLYTSRMFDSGLFVNGLARYGRLSTDATAGNMDGEYDNDAFSIGGNVGYRINFSNQAFVEPSFGLQYAYVKGDDYTAGNGVKVEQDDFDALIASLGARAGFNFPNDSGRLFARASVNHDFMGEIDGTASKGTVADSMYVDLGGTWFTYGVGAQFDVTKNLSFWGNIDRTTGGEVSTNYMMNAGLRYVF